MELLFSFAPIIVIIFVVGILLYSSAKQKSEEDAKLSAAIANIAPGVYIRSSQVDNPFRTEYDYVTVMEVKDGWVKYHYTKKSYDYMNEYSEKVERFARTYSPYPFKD